MGNESFKTKRLKAYNQEEERIYDLLQTTVISISKCDILMVMGDMNAKVGANRNGSEKELGQMKFGIMENFSQILFK